MLRKVTVFFVNKLWFSINIPENIENSCFCINSYTGVNEFNASSKDTHDKKIKSVSMEAVKSLISKITKLFSKIANFYIYVFVFIWCTADLLSSNKLRIINTCTKPTISIIASWIPENRFTLSKFVSTMFLSLASYIFKTVCKFLDLSKFCPIVSNIDWKIKQTHMRKANYTQSNLYTIRPYKTSQLAFIK